MIRHIVLWRLNGATAEERKVQAGEIKAALEALNGRIPGLRLLEVGIDISGEADAADVVLYSEFDSREALAAYHHHPLHQQVIPLVKERRCERRLVDYEVP